MPPAENLEIPKSVSGSRRLGGNFFGIRSLFLIAVLSGTPPPLPVTADFVNAEMDCLQNKKVFFLMLFVQFIFQTTEVEGTDREPTPLAAQFVICKGL
jgi:hypothetical protein